MRICVIWDFRGSYTLRQITRDLARFRQGSREETRAKKRRVQKRRTKKRVARRISREGERAAEGDPRIHPREAKQCKGAEQDSRETMNARWTKGKREKIEVSEINRSLARA